MNKPVNLAQVAVSPVEAWQGFVGGEWETSVDVRDFIQKNYTPYTGDAQFLAGPTEKTSKLWLHVADLMKQERAKNGPLDFDTEVAAGITSHAAGYIDTNLEVVVGLQTDAPLKRALMPLGGWKMAEDSCKVYGRVASPALKEIFTKYRKTHNQGVFDAYTPAMLKARKSGIITGLPDAYGRGRIIGDYRRVALYGIDRLIADKEEQKASLEPRTLDEATIRLREEITEQWRALKEMKVMAASYGFDISQPAKNGREAVQWLYFGYLAAVKSQNGAAMSIGRTSTFLDVYFARDLAAGVLTESDVQELVDQLVIKLRMVRFLRTPEYDELFSGDPTWVTESIGGMGLDGRPLVTKSSFRILHTLYNLGAAPEPNLTVLWSTQLPENFKAFCSKVSIDTSAIQYENDDLMRERFGDDYGIACCVSAMAIGKQMQFFGARCNLAKTLVYTINGGVDEKLKIEIAPKLAQLSELVDEQGYLVYDKVNAAFDLYMDWIANLYVNALNVIHFMHDKYCYEAALMALHDRDIIRTMACGIAGLSVAADSLSAMKYAKVKPILDDDGVVVDYATEGDYPKFGNNDARVDDIAIDLVTRFMNHVRKNPTYRNAIPTQSVLTITSNVVYGKKTGNTPDGRRAGQPFAPGANPMHGRDEHGALASLLSVSKLPYDDAEDGISYTFSMVPGSLGKDEEIRVKNMVGILDGYFGSAGHHINVNVFNREMLEDAMEHPELYPQLTIRVSGYAVNFIRLTRDQQLDVINRTFHCCM